MGSPSSWIVERRVAAARRRFAAGDVAGSVAHLRRTRALFPRSAEVALWLALAIWNEDEQAVEEPRALLRGAAAASWSSPTMLVRACTTLVGLGCESEIAPWVAQARALAGDGFVLEDELRFLEGCVHWHRGEYDDAEQALREAFYAIPEDPAGFHLAHTYVQLHRDDRALATAEESLRRGSRDPRLAELHAWLLAQKAERSNG